MALRNILMLLAAAQAARADFSHPLHYKTVDPKTAQGVAAAKGRAANAGTGDGDLFADQGFWFSHFSIGASPDLEILIDTGSADAIVNPGIYKASPKSVDTGKRFRISYATTNPDGSGSLTASGPVYQDVITQLGETNLTVPKQYLGEVDSPVDPPTFPHDGLIGYAGIDSSALGKTPFFHNLCDQGSLSACRFGLALKADETGTLFYGSLAKDQYKGDLVTAPLLGEWAVRGDVTVNGKTIQQRATFITDSGTTIVFGPTSQVKKIFEAAGIQGVPDSRGGLAGYYACDAPPKIGLSFSGTNFDMLPEALAFKKNGNNCTASVRGTQDFGSQWLVGQTFFQGRYIDHNVDQRTMGFANLK